MSLKSYFYGIMTDQRHGIINAIIKILLRCISIVYAFLGRVRRYAYQVGWLKSYRCVKPVISVGNITLGGVGKTPLVITIVQMLLHRQLKVAVLTRGYKSQESLFSDEAMMLKECLPGVPIITGANRSKGIEDCLKHHAVDVFVCDDAFGHLQLARDLNILVVNAVNPFGNRQVLPRGILREEMRAIASADIVLLSKTDMPHVKVDLLTQQILELAPHVMMVRSVHHPKACVDVFEKHVVDLSHFKGISVVGFCGLGDTNSFKSSLSQAGFHVVNVFGFMDHHAYTSEDISMIRKYAQDHHVQMIVTTHKDAVKLDSFKSMWDGLKVYYLKIDLDITHGKNIFVERIMSIVRH